MVHPAGLLMAFIAGSILGFFNFRCLWMTLRLLPSVKRPGRLMAFSTTVRVAVILVAFLLFVLIHWTSSISAMIGFIVMRDVITGRRRPICRA